MPKERKASAWESNDEEVRRLFLLAPDDLYFLRPVRADAQRLYRALVLLWARVERVLVSETSSIPEAVIKHVSKQLGLSPAVLSHLRNPPMMRSATFEAVRTYLDVRTFQEADEERLHAYLMEKVAHTGNYEALSNAEKAIVAVSHSLLVIIYHVLREKKPYTDLGADYFDKLDTARIERHHVRRLEQLGYTVSLTPAHAP
jgi:hypothetical protein